MQQYRLVVFTNPVEGREDEYNDWYDNTHLDDVLRIPGFQRAERFEQAYTLPPGPPPHRYLAIYDFESDDLDTTIAEFLVASRSGQMYISDAMAKDATPFVYKVLPGAKAL